MKKQFVTSSLVFLLMMLIISACKKDIRLDKNPIVASPPAPNLIIKFNNRVGDSALILHNAKRYINAHHDTFTVNTYKYYISNVKLIDANGSVFSEPESYHLINAASETTSMFGISGVPHGNYTSISFLIGVDSAHNDSGAQTGALDPVYGMFWTWNTGYIMAMLEGTSPQSPNPNGVFIYELLGFYGPYNIIKNVSIPFHLDTAKVNDNHTPIITFKSDIAEWFKTPAIIGIDSVNAIGISGQQALTIANNYADMFTYENIHN